MVWLAISGYGRDAPMRDWIAYGDDAGVAAGLSWLVGEQGRDPVFCGDAIADPLTGLHAALLALAAWRSGGGVLLDLALHGVAAWCIAVGAVEEDPAAALQVAQPRARVRHVCAVPAGSDTARVIREIAVGRA
jgi:crotonobetainyl-CoA:carnitine CoA-transferase CaiB-like acyl-CoA transferase